MPFTAFSTNNIVSILPEKRFDNIASEFSINYFNIITQDQNYLQYILLVKEHLAVNMVLPYFPFPFVFSVLSFVSTYYFYSCL
jgi:hypothetical protein